MENHMSKNKQQNRPKQQVLSLYLVKDELKSEIETRFINTQNTKPPVMLQLAEADCPLYIKKQQHTQPGWITWLSTLGACPRIGPECHMVRK
jgi:hypothetical protein